MKKIILLCLFYSTLVFSQSFIFVSINPFNITGFSQNNTPTFVDIDNDGDYDCFAGLANGFVVYYQNIGTSYVPSFDGWQYANILGIVKLGIQAKPTFADIDADGDYDVYVGEYAATIHFFRNTGSSTYPDFTYISDNPGGIANLGAYVAPVLVDINNDGKLDLFAGASDGNIYFYRNVGTPYNATFSNVFINPFGLSNVGLYSTPAFSDVDFDGDYDAFIGNQSGNILFFRNNGTADEPDFGIPITNPFGISNVSQNASPCFVDIDNDGKEDLFVGNVNGFTYYFRNTTVVSVEEGQNSSFVELKAYPNPVGNTLNISARNIDLDGVELSVYSILGEKINLSTTRYNSGASLNFSNLAPGIYILVIQNDVVNYTTKIIKGTRGF